MTDHIGPDDPALLASVRLGEGLRLVAYPDPLSPRGKQMALPLKKRAPGWATLSGAPWTIGHGHTSADIHAGMTCTQEQADAWMVSDLADAMRALDGREPWWRTTSGNRQRALAEIVLNMGLPHLEGFHKAMHAMQTQQWDVAKTELLDSAWHDQVGARAERLAEAIRVG